MFVIKKINRKDMIEYIAILWMIVSSGFFVLNYVYNLPCMIILLLIALYYGWPNFYISRVNADNLLGVLIFIFVDEIVTLIMYDYPFQINNLIILLIRLFALTMIMDKIELSDFMKKYINIFSVICLISLICFCLIQFTSIKLPFTRYYQDGFYGSFYFRVNEYTRDIATRNSGPYGEPGIFSVYIVIALVFLLFSTPVKVLTKRQNAIKILILSLTLLTTLSGTGLLCFLVVLFSYIVINLDKVNLLKNPFMLLLTISMIVCLYYTESTYGILEEKIINQGGSFGVRLNDTFTGYRIALNHFLTGTGIVNDYSSAWTGVLLDNSRSNGLANFVASVGIPFALFYLFEVLKSMFDFMNGKRVPSIIFFCVILIIFNTQPIVFQTIALSFLFRWKRGKGDEDKKIFL